MKPEKESSENQLNESAFDGSSSIDDFLRELEAKEKALDISPDLVIETEESDIEISEAEALEALKFLDIYREAPKAPKRPVYESSISVSQPFVKESSADKDEIVKLRQKISQLETDRLEAGELARRQKTDFENYRKRTERERNEMFRSVISNVAGQLLPVIDNLERALTSSAAGEKSGEYQQFRDGIGLVNQQLNDVLAEMGIRPIKSVGEPFDPHLHEAVAAEQTNKFPPHTVIAELLRGFQLDDKIIRHSLVKVSTTAKSEAILDESEVE